MAAIFCPNCKSKDVQPVNFQSNWSENQAITLKARQDRTQKTDYSCNHCGHFFTGSYYVPNHRQKQALTSSLDFADGWVWEWVGNPFKGDIGRNVKVYKEDGNSYTYFMAVFGEAYDEFCEMEEEGTQNQCFTVEFRFDKNQKLKGFVEKRSIV